MDHVHVYMETCNWQFVFEATGMSGEQQYVSKYIRKQLEVVSLQPVPAIRPSEAQLAMLGPRRFAGPWSAFLPMERQATEPSLVASTASSSTQPPRPLVSDIGEQPGGVPPAAGAPVPWRIPRARRLPPTFLQQPGPSVQPPPRALPQSTDTTARPPPPASSGRRRRRRRPCAPRTPRFLTGRDPGASRGGGSGRSSGA